MAMAILMLQPFAIERGAPCGGADEKSAGLTVSGCPRQIADALKSEHRIENIKGHHRVIGHTVRGRRRKPGRKSPRFVNALF